MSRQVLDCMGYCGEFRLEPGIQRDRRLITPESQELSTCEKTS